MLSVYNTCLAECVGGEYLAELLDSREDFLLHLAGAVDLVIGQFKVNRVILHRIQVELIVSRSV